MQEALRVHDPQFDAGPGSAHAMERVTHMLIRECHAVLYHVFEAILRWSLALKAPETTASH